MYVFSIHIYIGKSICLRLYKKQNQKAKNKSVAKKYISKSKSVAKNRLQHVGL